LDFPQYAEGAIRRSPLKGVNMKKFVISILAIILIVTATAGVSILSAEESDVYYQIKDDVVLFDGNDTDMTVVLPAGYWLKKESVDAIKGHIIASYNGYVVRFKQSDEVGMSKKSNFKSDTVLQYVHDKKLNVKFGGISLSKDADLSKGTGVTLTKDASLTFLSRTNNRKGEVVYLVITDAKQAGYVDASITTDAGIVVPEWKEPEPVDPPNTDNDNNNNNGGGTIGPDESKGDKLPTNNVVKIVLIVAICLLAVILVFLIFKPTRTKKNGRYRIDDDDRDDAYIDDRY